MAGYRGREGAVYRSPVGLPDVCSFADNDSEGEGEVEEGRELPFDISLPAKHLVSNLLHLQYFCSRTNPGIGLAPNLPFSRRSGYTQLVVICYAVP